MAADATGQTTSEVAGTGAAGDVLAVNAGSSSVKVAIFEHRGGTLRRLARGSVQRVGTASAEFTLRKNDDQETRLLGDVDWTTLAAKLIEILDDDGLLANVAAVGHRLVHGGSTHFAPAWITDPLLADLKTLAPLDPEHLPGELRLIDGFAHHLKDIPQLACFDTGFHEHLPRQAQLLPIPRRYFDKGIRRFGFHGISYSYLLEELAKLAGPDAANARVILAHLGAGASMTAVLRGQSVDTSMAFTPTAGLVMATRSGDLDPGVAWYLQRSEPMTGDQCFHMLNHESGLLGLSATTGDMRDLLAAEPTNPNAADAVHVFCYQARKWIGAFAAALEGLDTLVFAGGIGENAPAIRERICAGLAFLGFRLDPQKNQSAAGPTEISAPDSRVKVWLIPTDEERMIARTLYRMLHDRAPDQR